MRRRLATECVNKLKRIFRNIKRILFMCIEITKTHIYKIYYREKRCMYC